ncbi:MAG TPA: PQQ-dependent sugar dehydrogenase [Bryobacterales bacterium]|nr:PQQ-dependent sugar dehydrogenase [Bryobacterales bacterium]
MTSRECWWLAVAGCAVAVLGVRCSFLGGPAEAFSTEERILWTTSNIHGTPDPPDPYRPEVAFPNVKFYEPITMANVPGANKLIVGERYGKVYSFTPRRDANDKELIIDLKRVLYGVALHPRFAENGYVYMVTVPEMGTDLPTGSKLLRFKAQTEAPYRVDAASEQVLLEWPSGGHNGGCLRFGPDGYLYVVTGDASGIADERITGQDISDLPASVLRIDVDKPSGGKLYSVPADNPFVGRRNARPEIWAYGLRQLWKFSFDRESGRLWGGEIGQDLWEMIYVIEKGGNYGWSVREGRHPFRPERPKGPTDFVDPIVEHSHTEFRSITGGYVYHGERLPELKGAYLYGDYDTGRLWMLRYDGERVSDHKELMDTQFRIIEFAQTDDGEVYFADFVSGNIYRPVAAPPPDANAPRFPELLSETGLFASTEDMRTAAGLIPYTVNSPLWSDGALKERYLALPGDSKISYNTLTYPQPAPGAPPGWQFPDGAVAVKTFSLEMETGNPESVRRLETRLLVHEKIPGTDEFGEELWHGYTYVWNDEQTDAVLLKAEGLDRELTIKDAAAPGGERKQVWRFPSRAECTLCHTMPAKYLLGVNTRQLNRDHQYGEVTANQLAVFQRLGLFEEPLPGAAETLPRVYDPSDTSVSLDLRARSYLDANCAHCHRKWGGGNAEFQLVTDLPVKELGIVNAALQHGDFGLMDPHVLTPGAPEQSMMLHRMSILGLGRMPHIASTMVDEKGVRLIQEWIAQLPAE